MGRPKGYHDPLENVTPKTFKDVARRIIETCDRDSVLKIRGRILDEISERLKKGDAKTSRALGLRALNNKLKSILVNNE